MVSIIVDEDQNSRAALHNMLMRMGFHTIIEASCPLEAEKALIKYASKLELLLVNDSFVSSFYERFDLRWATILTLREKLDRKHATQKSLLKPFSYLQLKSEVTEAFRSRAQVRKEIAYLGDESQFNRLVVSLETSRPTSFHWRKARLISNQRALEQLTSEQVLGIGTFFIDPACGLNPQTLQKYKTTLPGRSTSMICLAQDPGHVGPWRRTCDLFLKADTAVDLEFALQISSNRLLNDWFVQQNLAEAKVAIKTDSLREAKRILDRTQNLAAVRWEFNQLSADLARHQGNTRMAVELYFKVLQSNPCSPKAYLSLLDLLPQTQREPILKQALAYCPQHPQIREFSEHLLIKVT